MPYRIITLIIISTSLLVLFSCGVTDILTSPDIVDALKLEDVRYNETLITPQLYASIPTTQNLVWCSAFELAWKKLSADINVSIDMQEMPVNAENLNDSVAKPTDLNDADYFIQCGKISENVLGLLNYNLKKRFPESNAEYKPDIYIPESFVLYTYFYKNVKFANNFEQIAPQMKFHTPSGEITVDSFGINKNSDTSLNKNLWQQVSLDYIENDKFIVSLKPEFSGDEFIFAMIPPEESLYEMIDTAEDLRNSQNIDKNNIQLNQLQIPLISFEFEHFYKELQHKYFTNSGYEDFFISKAGQRVKFLMNKKGAYIDPITIDSEQKIANPGATSKIQANLIFNKPFLMYVKKDNSQTSDTKEHQPYLAVYFNNAEFFYIQN